MRGHRKGPRITALPQPLGAGFWAGQVQLVLDLYAVTEEMGTAYWELEMRMVPSHFLDHDPSLQ